MQLIFESTNFSLIICAYVNDIECDREWLLPEFLLQNTLRKYNIHQSSNKKNILEIVFLFYSRTLIKIYGYGKLKLQSK